MSETPTLAHRFPPELTVAELIDKHYIPAAGCRRVRNPQRQIGQRRIQQIQKFSRILSAYLHRDAVVADLTPETCEAFLDWHRKAFVAASGRWMRTDFKAILRFCKIIPDRRKGFAGRKGRPLSDVAGSLWQICRDEYFPKSMRIRDDKTRLAYRMAFIDYAEVLGRTPMLADLTDDNLIAMMVHLQAKKLAAKTVNERSGRIKTFWNWCAKRRMVEQFPCVERVPEPRRLPRAWSHDELARLFASCHLEYGMVVEGVTAADWWTGLHWVLWSTGERIGAILACRWDWLNMQTGYLQIDAEHRKGKDADFLHKLRPEALEVLAKMKPAGHEKIFPWPYHEGTFYNHYNRILRRAGLACDRKSKTHRMRKSVASHLQAQGIDASIALGHSSSAITRKSYLDPRIVCPRSPADALFNPEDVASPEVLYLPAIEPKLIEYREPPPADVDPSLAWIA